MKMLNVVRAAAKLFLAFSLLASSSALKAQGLTGKSFTGQSFKTSAFVLRLDYGRDDSDSENSPQAPAPAVKKIKTLSFKGGPRTSCKWFLITENGFAAITGQRPELSLQRSTRVHWEWGLMKNAGERYAVGGAFYVSFEAEDDRGFLFGFKPRFRYWLTRRFTADFAPGLLFAQSGNVQTSYKASFPGFEGHVGLGFADWVSLSLHLELLHLEPKFSYQSYAPPIPTQKNWYIGITFGSYPGAILSPISGALAVLAHAIALAD